VTALETLPGGARWPRRLRAGRSASTTLLCLAQVLALASALGWALAPALAALTFPPLTGRVVDGAGILPPETEISLDQKLAMLETKTSDQLVVATVPSLQGTDIAEFGYQLGRSWGLGQGKLNNGALLIVAPEERKLRIEVGYGLEGTLTDALSSVIIQQAILPKFKAGDMPAGIEAGVDAIVSVLTENESEWKARAAAAERSKAEGGGEGWVTTLIVLVMIAFYVLVILNGFRRSSSGGQGAGMRGSRRRGRHDAILTGTTIGAGSSWGGGGSWDSGGSSGGGFSGGGGSFGGGGSSGSW
jgi:uncharacterized protein